MPKKKQKMSTLITFVQDETGSMSGIRQEVITAYNAYFENLKGETYPGEVRVNVLQFSDMGSTEERVRVLYKGDLSGVEPLVADDYRPRGVTPLLDAVGTAIRQAEGEQVDRHLLIVQTDGLENASRDFNLAEVEKLVKEKEAADNWTIVFLGAGIQQWSREAARMGVAAASTTSYDPSQTPQAYASLSSHTQTLLRSQGVGAMPETATLVQKDLDKDKKSQ